MSMENARLSPGGFIKSDRSLDLDTKQLQWAIHKYVETDPVRLALD